ncbi:MAG: DUF2764 domain-containing protein [Treponema sp.]|nr:DUF2764 domain-containing protein [Treponema sp.]
MAYYYLTAQLPYLIYGQQAPMTSVAFKSLCANKLSATDAALLERCSLDPESAASGDKASYAEVSASTGSVFLDEWRAWERTLRLNLARFRAQKQKRDSGSSVEPPESPADAAAAAKSAMALESPLEAEQFLDEMRWRTIETLQGIDYFDVNTIYAYLLKLLIMERKSAFKVEEGFAEYKGLYDAILASASKVGV